MDFLRYSSLAVCLTTDDQHVIPYHEASIDQQDNAIRCAHVDLQPAYPRLSWLDLNQAFNRVQPDLGVMHDGCAVTYCSLLVLVRYLNQVHGQRPTAEQLPDARTLYLAEKLYYGSQLVQQVLAQLNRNSPAYPALVDFAAEDAQTRQACQLIDWLPLAPPRPDGPLLWPEERVGSPEAPTLSQPASTTG